MSDSNLKQWMWIVLLIVGIIWGVGPFKLAQCSRNKSVDDSSISTQNSSD